MRRKLVITLGVVLVSILASSVSIAFAGLNDGTMWDQTYGGTENDYANFVVQTSDGGYAIAGYTESFGAGGQDFWLIKTDENGNVVWNQTYGGTEHDVAYSLVQSGDGGYAVAGDTESFGAGNSDFWLVKVDSSGNTEWDQTYGGTEHDNPYSLVQTGDGGYAFAGYTNSFGAGNGDFWLVKTDSLGNVQWNQTYGGTGDEIAASLVKTSDGGYAIAGYTNSLGAGDFDSWLVKTDASGNLQWDQTYGGTDRDVTHSMVKTTDEGYALAGATESFGAGMTDFWAAKTDEQGAIPELSTWVLMVLLLTITLVAIVIKRKHSAKVNKT